MGLGPIMAIYQARFNRYLEHRGLKDTVQAKGLVLPRRRRDRRAGIARAPFTLASRESLDNLIFVVNCNLQRLDGPVRGNGKIIQELEAAFRGAGWNVIKVIWGSDWDPLLAKDKTACSSNAWAKSSTASTRKYTVEPGAYIREHFFGKYPELAQAGRASLATTSCASSDAAATTRKRSTPPTRPPSSTRDRRRSSSPRRSRATAWARPGEGRNITHQQKKLNEEELREFRTRFGIPISDKHVAEAPFLQARRRQPEMKYLRERRQALGGYVPGSARELPPHAAGPPKFIEPISQGQRRQAPFRPPWPSSTCSAKLLHDKEARQVHRADHPRRGPHLRHGRACSRQFGIYSNVGQLYEPVDAKTLLPTTARPRTARFSKRASPKPARCRRSSPRAPPTPTTACR